MNRTSGDKITIRYYFPVLGKVEIKLEGYSAQFYNFLEKNGEIERLKRLKHLGILSDLFPGVRHTRYEYILLNLYLARKLKLSDRRDKRIANLLISKREFLDLLILSANIGHVYGTFAVEKALLSYLWENNLLDQLLEKMNHKNIKKGIKDKLGTWLKEQQDYRFFNKILALVKLKFWMENYKNSDLKNLLQAVSLIIANLLLRDEREEYQEDLYKKYNFMRKISYLFLDSFYIYSPLKVSFLEVFKNLQNDFKNIINNIEVLKLIHQYEQLVYTNLYHQDHARLIVGLIGKEIQRVLKDLDKKRIFEIILSWLKESEIKEISTKLENIVNSTKNNYSNICNISLNNSLAKLVILENGIANTEKEISQKIKNKHVIPLILLSDEISNEISWEISGKMWIDLFASSNIVKKDYVGILTKICDYINSLDLYFGETEIYEKLFQLILKYAIAKQGISVQLKKHPSEFFGGNVIPAKIIAFRNLKTRKDDVKEEIKKYFSVKEKPEWSKSQKEKFHEHIALWELIKLLRRRLYKGKTRLRNRLFLILPCSIIITDEENNKYLAEFDGAILEMRIKSGKAILYLLEAKRSRKGNAVDELNKKLRKLGITLQKIEKLKKSDGWAIWQLN